MVFALSCGLFFVFCLWVLVFCQILFFAGHSLNMCFNNDPETERWSDCITNYSIWNGPEFDANYDYANDPLDLRGHYKE